MKRFCLTALLAACACAALAQEAGTAPGGSSFLLWEDLKKAIERHLGRPYVWGACGFKSFDCSGFLWRVMTDNGVLIKRTTARKFYVALPKAEKDLSYSPGNVVFFDDLKHVGIVSDRGAFYHAAVTKGTHLAPFDPFWRRKVVGFRLIPQPRKTALQ